MSEIPTVFIYNTPPSARFRKTAALLAFFLPLAAGMNAGVSEAADASGGGKAEFEARVLSGPSLEDLKALAYLVNPSIAAAREDWRGKTFLYETERALPDPRLRYQTSPESDSWKISLSQEFPFPGTLAAAARAADSEALVGRLLTDQAVRDVFQAAAESFWEILYLREARVIAARNGEILAQLTALGESAMSADRATLMDVLKAQSQTALLAYDALLFEELERTETARLNALLGRPSSAAVGPMSWPQLPDLALTLSPLQEMAVENRIEVRTAEAVLQRESEAALLARRLNRPGFELGAGIDDAKVWEFEAAVNLPLWPWKNRGRARAAEASQAAAAARLESLLNSTRAEVAEAFFRCRNAERLARLYADQLLPQAQRAMDTAESWHRQGVGSFSDYLETRAVWSNFQLAAARARADQGRFLARLESLVGRTLGPPTSGQPSRSVP